MFPQNSVDLSEFMADDDKTYYYEVKAVPTTSDEKKYLKEGNFVSSTSQELDWDEETDNGTGDGGSVKGNNYVLPDGTKETDTWKKSEDIGITLTREVPWLRDGRTSAAFGIIWMPMGGCRRDG